MLNKKISYRHLGLIFLLPLFSLAQSNPDLDKEDIIENNQVIMNRSDLQYIIFIDNLWKDGFQESGLFSKKENRDAVITTINPDQLKERLKKLQQLSKMDIFKYNGSVHAAVESYLRMGKHMGKIFALAEFYSPLFEKTLEKYNIPKELKYLAIVESNLNSRITSSAGAQGLWQFMPATGRMYDLAKNTLYDERNDPVKSTEAAARYLKDLYDHLGNWELVLAAYNSGPGTVDRAIGRQETRNFWELSKVLPKETRNYIPKFIAINYVMKYYKEHHIEPEHLNFRADQIASVTIHEKIHLGILAKELGISREELTFLNPQYNLGIIPGGQKKSLHLPKNKLVNFHAKEMEIYAASQAYQISNQSGSRAQKRVAFVKKTVGKNLHLSKKKVAGGKNATRKSSALVKNSHRKNTNVRKKKK